MSNIDLSDFLSDPSLAKQKNTNKNDDFSDLREQKLPYGHVRCTQCFGAGKVNHTRHTIVPISVDKEELYERFGIEPKGIPPHAERIKCPRCNGLGSHTVPDDVRSRTVVQWWTRYRCACGAQYEAPSFGNQITIKSDIYRAIIRKGKQFGWRYHRTVYMPCDDICGLTLPYKIEYFEQRIHACRKCAHQHLVICLPDESQGGAA